MTKFTFGTGKPIKLTLKHIGKIPKEAMGHNLVILQEGTDQTAFALKANDAKATDYIPESILMREKAAFSDGPHLTTKNHEAWP